MMECGYMILYLLYLLAILSPRAGPKSLKVVSEVNNLVDLHIFKKKIKT